MPFRDVFTWHLQVFGKPEGRYLHSGEEAVYFIYFLSDWRYRKADETNERNLINQPIQHPQTIYFGSCNRSVTWSLSLPQGLRPVSMLLWLRLIIHNSESVGFQSLGPGTGDTKMHAPQNRNSPGTLLEPFAVGLQSGANYCIITNIY